MNAAAAHEIPGTAHRRPSPQTNLAAQRVVTTTDSPQGTLALPAPSGITAMSPRRHRPAGALQIRPIFQQAGDLFRSSNKVTQGQAAMSLPLRLSACNSNKRLMHFLHGSIENVPIVHPQHLAILRSVEALTGASE